MLTFSRNHPLPKIPLRIVLIGPFVALIVLTVGLVGYLSYRNGQQAVNAVAYQLRTEITQRIQNYVGAFLETPQRINQLNANALRQGLLDLNNPPVLEHYLWEQIQSFDSVSSIYVGNTNGGIENAGREGAQGSLYVIATEGFSRGALYKYATDSKGQRTTLLATVPDFDARTRPWYTGAVKQGGPAWSEVYLLSTGQDMAVAASRPVYDEDHNLLGVASVDIFLSQLSHFLKSLPAGKTGQSFIMERSGLLIASSMDEKPFTPAQGNEAPRRLSATESATPLIQAAVETLSQRLGGYDQITSEQNLEFELAGQRQFLQVAPVHEASGIDWLIVVVIPEADFMAQIEANNRTTAMLIGLALLSAVILGVITAQGIIRPISRLDVSAQALAQGEWQPIVSQSWIGEISGLTQSFNKMAGQLQQTLANLTAEITERKQAEAVVHWSESLLQIMAGSSPLAFFVVDNRTDAILYFNQRFCEIWGITHLEERMRRDELKNHDIIPDCLPLIKDVPAFAASCKPLQDEFNRAVVEDEIAFVDGRTIRRFSTQIRSEHDEYYGRFYIFEDVTQRKQMEEAVARDRALLRTVIDLLPDAIYAKDTAGRKTVSNRADVYYSGAELEAHVLGKTDPEFYPPDVAARFEADDQMVVQTGAALLNREEAIPLPDGQLHWFLSNKVPLRDGKGQVIGLVGVGRDITERKQMEAELLAERASLARRVEERTAELNRANTELTQAMQAKDEFLAAMSHELRTPLTAILGMAEVLQEGIYGPLNERQLKSARTIEQSVRHLLALITDILDLAKAGAGKLELDLQLVSVTEYAQASLLFVKEMAGKKNLNLSFHLEDWGAYLQADPRRLKQILVNLLSNAVKFTPAGGRVSLEVRADPEQEAIHFAVQDTGIGIKAEDVTRLFKPFTQLDASLSRQYEGAGLGLALVQQLVELHGGTVGVESEGVTGLGSRFTVSLPSRLPH